MLLEQTRLEIVSYGKKMSIQGLSRGTSGNLSCFDPGSGYMAISPSGLDYFETAPEDIVIMDLSGNIIEGSRKPSSEHGLHAAFYRAKGDTRAVVHTHSTYCSTLSCLRLGIEPVHYMVADAGAARVPCAEYHTFGTPQLAEGAVAACGSGRAVLLANHGLVTCGSSMAKAFAAAVNVEFTAEMQWRTMAVGRGVALSDAEMNEVLAAFGRYGQNAGGKP